MRAIFYPTPSRFSGLCQHRGTPQWLLLELLSRAGCEVLAPSVLDPSVVDQRALEPGSQCGPEAGRQLAERLLTAFRNNSDQSPAIWITGGICPHAPDWVGLRVSREMGIPYVLIEPQIGAGTSELATPEEKESAKNSVRSASATITTSSQTARGLSTLLENTERLTHLLPFFDLAPCFSASHLRDISRRELIGQLGLPLASACLVTDGTQEPGPSLDAWQMLSLALSRIVMLDWHILVLGRGGAEQEVRRAMRRLPAQRVHYLPDPKPKDRLRALAGSDLYIWPATDETSLSSLLEAQATGTPVVACSSSDVADRVLDGQTGRLCAANAESLANGISFLLRHPNFRTTYSQQARETAVTQHDLRSAAAKLRGILTRVVSVTEAQQKIKT